MHPFIFQLDPAIYPRHVCKACDTQLIRTSKWIHYRKGRQPQPPSQAAWQPHGKNCIICQTKTSSDKRQADTENESEPPAKIISDSEEIHSIDPSRAVDQKMIEKLICTICRGVPTYHSDPVIASCGHVHCRNCILSWLKIRNTCPHCREDGITPESLVSIQVFLCNVLTGVKLRCIYSDNGCQHQTRASNVQDLHKHEQICTYKRNPEDPKRLYLKSPLITRDSKYVRAKRLKEITHKIKTMCREKDEVFEDVLFFLLKDNIDSERAAVVQALWGSNFRNSLTPSQSLALKVDLKLSDNNYTALYKILKEHLPVSSVVSLEKVKEEAKRFMPSAVTFQVGVSHSWIIPSF